MEPNSWLRRISGVEGPVRENDWNETGTLDERPGS